MTGGVGILVSSIITVVNILAVWLTDILDLLLEAWPGSKNYGNQSSNLQKLEPIQIT